MASVLILGGTGFIGRNLVEYLLQDDSRCSFIRVCDKTPPALAFMTQKQLAMYKQDKVQFMQLDLTKDAHVVKAFDKSEDRGSFQYVINLCGETRFGLPDSDYQNRIVGPALRCGQAARDCGAKWLEVSTAVVYNPTSENATETSSLKPWTTIAKYRLEAENVLRNIPGLDAIILRPSLVYGPGDLTSLTPRLSIAAVYQFLKQKMKCLWSANLAIHCVHVTDVCNAIWTALTHLSNGAIVNVSDESMLTQGALNSVLEEIFKIDSGFHGKILSNLAKLNFSAVVEQANSTHVPGWQKLCANHGISTTPVSPFLDATLLGNNSLAVDGSALTQMTPFRYQNPRLTKALLEEQLRYFTDLGLFPVTTE